MRADSFGRLEYWKRTMEASMNCDDYQRNFSKLMDNELGEEECAQLFTHLGICPACREFFRTSMQIQSALDELRVPEPPGLSRLPSLRQNNVIWTNPISSFIRRLSETRIPLSFATAILVFAMAGMFALSSLWIHSHLPSEKPKERDVFIHMLPAVDIQPQPVNQKRSHH